MPEKEKDVQRMKICRRLFFMGLTFCWQKLSSFCRRSAKRKTQTFDELLNKKDSSGRHGKAELPLSLKDAKKEIISRAPADFMV